MRLKKNHPWNPGYALPAHVLGETRGQAHVTRMAPRGSYDDPAVPATWDGGYALPAHVRNERPGQEARITPWARRGTGGQPAPSEFANTALQGLGGPMHAVSSSSKLARGTAAIGGRVRLGTSGDPIARFGREGAVVVMESVRAVPAAERTKAMRAMLNAIDPTMWQSVEQKMASAKTRGIRPPQAIQGAVAAALANHFTSQMIQMGRTGAVPMAGVMGLSYYGEGSVAHQQLEGYLQMEGIWDSIKSGVKKAGGAVVSGAKATVGGVKAGLSKLGKLACKASNSGLLTLAASGAGMAGAGPGGAAAAGKGAEMVGNLCPAGSTPVTVPQGYAPATGMSTQTKVLIGVGGAGLLAVLLLTR